MKKIKHSFKKNQFFKNGKKEGALLPIIFIPGIICSVKMWDDQLSYFSKKTKVFIIDVLTTKSVKELAKNICDSHKEFNLVGFSSGGYIAQEIAANYPGKVNKLILINTSGGKEALERQEKRKSFLDSHKSKESIKGMDDFKRKLLSTYDIKSDVYLKLNNLISEISADVFSSQMKSIIEYIEDLPELTKIRCPVLIIANRFDPFLSPNAYFEMKRELWDVTLMILDDGGHMLPISRPGVVNKAIEDFIFNEDLSKFQGKYNGL